jgi:hypothetical protein
MFKRGTMLDTTTTLYDRSQRVSVDDSDSARQIPNHPTQSVTAIDGWSSVLFGVPFLLAGIGLGLGAMHAVHSNSFPKRAPEWLIALFAAFFFCPGAFLMIHGLLGVNRKMAYKRNAAANPGQLWLADYHWQREGSAFSSFQVMLGRFVGAVLWDVFLIPFFWIGLTERGLNRLFFVFASLFAVLGLYFWVRWAKMLADLLRYGSSFLHFDSFPYFLGGTFNGRLSLRRNLDALEELTLTFRCIQEKYVTTGTGENRTTSVVCYELYKDAATLSRSQLAGAASSGLPVSFRIPQQQPATRLSDAPPTYWQIEARGKASGADYEAYFLVPVYKPQ